MNKALLKRRRALGTSSSFNDYYLDGEDFAMQHALFKLSQPFGLGELSYDERGAVTKHLSQYSVQDKNTPFQTFLHYTDDTFPIERTVFGREKGGLFYNYSDRLGGDGWNKGAKLAHEKGLEPHSAAFYEECLKAFHEADSVDLQHVVLGGNNSNGCSYLIFGYRYTKDGKTH